MVGGVGAVCGAGSGSALLRWLFDLRGRGGHDGRMTTVGARELENRLGRYLRQVEAGETILVTKRGRPVAELRPMSPAALDGARLQKLAAKGVVRLPTRQKSQQIPRVVLPGPPLSETILEDREDRI